MPSGINPYSGKPYSKRYFDILETRKKLPVRPARSHSCTHPIHRSRATAHVGHALRRRRSCR
eukprot:scaffold180336_cov26-Tisochrysis_lutea.AAC.4